MEAAGGSQPPVFLGGEYNPPAFPEETAPSDLMAFLFIVVVPLAVIMVIVLVLGYMMCGRREGV